MIKTEVQRIAELPEFDPNGSYSPQQLEDYGTEMLMIDRGERRQIRSDEIETQGPEAECIRNYLRKVERATTYEIASSLSLSFWTVRVELIALGDQIRSDEQDGKTTYRLPDIGIPKWLNASNFDYRRRREIYSNSGEVDPSVVQGLFNRTHPQGRPFNTRRTREKHGSSFYRN